MKAICVLLLFALVAAQDCGSKCPFDNVKCVGEGQFCQGDLDSKSCSASSFGVCPVCSTKDLTCHMKMCLKKNQSLAAECCPPGETNCDASVQHLFCLDGLNCAYDFLTKKGVCTAPTVYLQAGDTCVPTSTTEMCGGSLRCNAVNNRCEFYYLVAFAPGSCYTSDDCPYNQYCLDSTTPSSCVASFPSLDTAAGRKAALGQACTSGAACSHSYDCFLVNPFEQDARFRSKVCEKYYSRGEGSACESSMQCANGLYCSSNFCVASDTSCAGERCSVASACGRGMACKCPPSSIGGGFARCIGSDTQQTAWSNRYWWSANLRYKECLDNNKCQLAQSSSKCAIDHCSKQLAALPPTATRVCSNQEPAYGRQYPSSAAATSPLVALFVGSIVLLQFLF